METRIHPVTGKTLTRDTRVQEVSYLGLTAQVELPGWYPDDSSDSIHSGADLEPWEAAVVDLKQRAEEREKDSLEKNGQ